MNSQICHASALLTAMLVFGLCSPASAATIAIQLDENGNGSITVVGGSTTPITGTLQQDPGPGGEPSALTYVLGAPGLTAGDLLLTDPALDDAIRFNAAGSGGNPNYLSSVVFYSSDVGGLDSLADTLTPPSAFYSNSVTLPEVGGGIQYTPLSGEPGFVPGSTVTYSITSSVATVPEPTSLLTSLGGCC